MKFEFRPTFVTGLIIALPLLITLWVVHFVFSQITGAVTPFILNLLRLMGAGRWVETAWVNWLAPIVSIALTVVAIYLLGLVGGNVLGRQVLKSIDRLLMQVPFVRGIYSATRQFLDTFSGAKGLSFSRVVLVEYPRPGLWTMGFVTNDTRGEVQSRTDRTVLSVFLPTTPNPTSGWLAFIREEDIIPLTMSVDDAFKMIVSCGVLSPPYYPDRDSSGPGLAQGHGHGRGATSITGPVMRLAGAAVPAPGGPAATGSPAAESPAAEGPSTSPPSPGPTPASSANAAVVSSS